MIHLKCPRRLNNILAVALLLLGLGSGLAGSHAHAQDGRPLVVFVVDRRLQVASIADNGPDGVSRLGEIFRAQGAVTQIVRLSQPLPPEADVIVLVGPRRSISAEYLGRLWLQMANYGSHLLIAIDPAGHDRRGTDRADGGLPTLLSLDYGVSLLDTFLVEPWFTLDSASGLDTNYLFAEVDPYIPHPVSDPLRVYDVPVALWGARSMEAEALGPDSKAYSLLQTVHAYGETDLRNINRGEAPLELNLGEDVVGRQTVAALGIYTPTGARIAVFGDSEMLQNGYGLAVTGAGLPRLPGNRLLAERTAAWLLERPLEDWPPLPAGVTWIAVDGQPDDWAQTLPAVAGDGVGDADRPYDLQQVRGFRNNDYLYLLAETAAPPPAGLQVLIGSDATFDGQSDTRLLARQGEVVVLDDTGEAAAVLPDAAVAVDTGIELRIPLRTLGGGLRFQISELCLFTPAEESVTDPAMAQDCLGRPLAVTSVAQNDVFNLRFPDAGLLVTVRAARGGNLRMAPTRTATVLGVLFTGEMLDAIGRDENGEWIQVRNARYSGWMAGALLVPNGDLMSLPVTSSSAGGL